MYDRKMSPKMNINCKKNRFK